MVFGPAINTDTISVVQSPAVPFQGDNAVSPYGNIQVSENSSIYSEDYSKTTVGLQGLFVHELTHVYQYQNGVDVAALGLPLQATRLFFQNPYALPPIDENTDFNSLNIEQQGDLVRNYYYKLVYGNPNDPTPLSVYQHILPFQGYAPINVPIPQPRPTDQDPQCFLAGTPILMADGTEKPIEEIKPGDEVMAFDGGDNQGLGPTVPKKVTRLFRNVTKSIINLRGVKMTPGHVVLSDNGDWLTIADVLRNDRGLVEERKAGAVLVRARTGATIGSLDDTPIRVLFVDQKTGRQHQAVVRAGIPALAKRLGPNKAELWTLARILIDEGYTVSPDGWMTLPNGQRFNATPWPASSPFDTEMMLSWIISLDGAPYTPPWIADIREDEEQETVNAGFSQPHSAISFRPTNPASGRPLNRAERRRQATFRVVK
jgi:hypothetical protein